METPPPPDLLLLPDVGAWRAWLDANEDSSDGVSLVLAKKGVTEPTSLSYADALQEALCSGWIDGRRNARDATTFLQRFTPRRSSSIWSQRNAGYVADLVASGRMRPRGLAEVELAQADGRWARAYPGPAAAEPPEDLVEALAASPRALSRFEALSRTDRYLIIARVLTAPSAAARAGRIRTSVARLDAQTT